MKPKSSKRPKPQKERLDVRVLEVLIANVRIRRTELNITQETASIKAGLDPNYWAAFEIGRRPNPGLRSLCAIADVLETEPATLLKLPEDS